MLLKKENHIHRFARRIPEYNARRQYFKAWHQPSVAISQLFFNKTTSVFSLSNCSQSSFTNVIYGKDRNKIYCIYEDGSCGQIPNHFLERSELLKTFSTWQEAVNSPEFKGERHD